jgi:nitrite reductase/ring-hydroxylating ferredoxin subunit
MTRTFVCRTGELADGEARRIGLDPPVAVFRVGDDFYATADSCTHEEWSLGEEGETEGFEVTCSLHMARFDIRTGRPLCLPAVVALRSYSVFVEDGNVYLSTESAVPPDTPAPGLAPTPTDPALASAPTPTNRQITAI